MLGVRLGAHAGPGSHGARLPHWRERQERQEQQEQEVSVSEKAQEQESERALVRGLVRVWPPVGRLAMLAAWKAGVLVFPFQSAREVFPEATQRNPVARQA